MIMADQKDKYDELRTLFQEKYADKITQGAYDERDINRLNTNDSYAGCFINALRTDVEEAAKIVNGSFSWRKEIGVNDLNENSFPQEAHEKGAIYYHNHDKDGNDILYFRIKDHKKDSSTLLLLQKYVAFMLERYFQANIGKRIVVLFDMAEAGLTNMDLDLVKYIITCFTSYYPSFLAYILIYDMPWVLNTAWKIIKAWLSEEAKKKVIFVKKNEIQEYIDRDQLWEHMGGTDSFEYKYTPSPSPENEQNGELHSPDSAANKKRVTFAENDHNTYQSFSVDQEDAGSPPKNEARLIKVRPKTLAIASRRPDREENSFRGKYATICPAEELEFELGDGTKESLYIITITNTVKSNVAFKVKTTAPEKYRVRPSSGVIKPAGTGEVSVFLQAGHSSTIHRDKFLVMTMEVEAGVSNSEIGELWRTASRDDIMEHRLRCNIVTPKSPETMKQQEVTQLQTTVLILTKKLDQIYAVNSRLEERLTSIYKFQLFFMTLVVIGAVIVVLYFKDISNISPEKKTNSCNIWGR
ncbi:motile sperm domain-containing protein 2-like isoform X2 [Tubulanus polymorphus]|uniref:motile sperm domain-containing protein 2-like isoform X2 n=1 Tax=Tubulanus polymorphus TaxID=672921 RepID=UPI003DA4542A